MTAEEARERVNRGAALLDQRRPGWAGELDLNTLHMASCDSCVLGQLFDGYFIGTRRLAIQGRAADLGFEVEPPVLRLVGDVSLGSLSGSVSEVYALLRAAWTDAVHARITPPVEWTHREPEQELIGT